MSKASATPNKTAAPSQTTAPNASAWSRGPPAAASNPSSNVPSTASTPPPPPNGASNESATGSTPVSIGGGNSRKGSLMVGGNGDVMPRGNLAFGTVDSPNPLLSSSPAAPSTTGGHLADTVKSFGSIDAETNAAGASMIRPPRRTSGGANPATPTGGQKKQLDVHSLFAGKPHQPSGAASGTPMSAAQMSQGSPAATHDRRQSGGPMPGANGMPNFAPQATGMPGQSHLRPMQGMPSGQRSPVMGGAPQPQYPTGQMPPQGTFRLGQTPMQGGQSVRPGGMNPQMMAGRPMMGQPYMHSGPQPYSVMYGGGNSGYYYPYTGAPDQYGWTAAPHANTNMPLSPRQQQAQLHGSPAPPNATLPGSGGASPLPTPPSRPQSLGGSGAGPHSTGSPMPSTPSSRPMQPATPFSPTTPTGSSGGLSAGAAAFTPRAKAAVKISRPDGTAFDLAEAAAAAKGPASSSTSGVATPEPSAEDAGSVKPQKKIPSLPHIVRMETEEQKKARLEEEAMRKKMKEEEEREEQERKERKERRAKAEAEEAAAAAAKAKEEEAAKAKSDADAKAKAEAEAEAKAKATDSTESPAAAKSAEVLSTPADAKKTETESSTIEDSKTDGDGKESALASPVGDKDKGDELRRSLLTPTTQSAAPSPLASPALAAAGLPAKPVAAIGSAAPRRTTPTSDKPASTQASPAASTSYAPSVLSKAKPIEDLASVTYPASVKPLNASLNANAEPGKFRYDRDFLMQFMDVCKEKPDSLPPLEEIGLEADTSSGFGSRRPGRPTGAGGRNSGLALQNMGGGRSFSSGMGSFNFASSSIRGTSGTTSEERYMRSIQGGRIPGGMSRSSSQNNSLPPMGLPPMAHSTSRRSDHRGSNRGVKRQPQNDPDVAPLVVSANAWVNARSAGPDEKSPAYVERKVKALLNKLTEEKFDSISAQILEWANKSRDETDGMTLKLVIKLVFEKSTDEAHWSAMYAKLCRKLLDELDPAVTEVIDGKPVSGGSLFRKYLLGRCQNDFESGWKAREEAALAASSKSTEDKERLAKAEESKEEGGEAPMMSDEYYALQKAKRRGLGLIQLIGELYKLDMLSRGVIKTCLLRLLNTNGTPDEEDLESTCKLLTTVGRRFEQSSPGHSDAVFKRLKEILDEDAIPSRIRFMLMDVIDLQKNGWRSRKEVVPTTIAQIHQQAARENAEKAQAAAHVRESMSRGGSRSGHRREGREGPQPGEWQSVAAGPRPPQRPTDFSNIGRGVSSNLSSGPTFGPTSVFGRGKKGGATGATPPISRQSSSANMFAMLNEADAGSAESAEAAEPGPQRKRLQLQPRTKPLPGQEDEAEQSEAEAASDGEGKEEAAKPSMTEQEASEKIGRDLKELWGEKDTGGSRDPDDIVEYYRVLPSEYQHLLSVKLAEDVFRIAKIRDAEVVASGWTAALKNDVVSAEDLKKGVAERMVTLDDDAIDFPQAYKAIAVLMRSLSLSQDEIDSLVEKIDVYGEPKITPKMKLDKAFGQLDEEATA